MALNLAGLETNVGPGQHAALFRHVMRHERRRFVLDPALPADAVSHLNSVSCSTAPFSHPTSLLSLFTWNYKASPQPNGVHVNHSI